jgi:hypothetical protein
MHASHHANRERFIPVHTICEEIGSDVAQALPAAHALTEYNQQLVLNLKEIGVSNKISPPLQRLVHQSIWKRDCLHLVRMHCPFMATRRDSMANRVYTWIS